MTLKEIHTINIQGHKDITVTLPETGLIRFNGDNSNGKSIIRKALEYICSNAINKPIIRKSLVRRGQPYGEIILTRYDDMSLMYHIHKEAAQTYAELSVPGKLPIRRYLSDKTIPELREYFGLHYSTVAERSLNLMNPDDSLLFFRTPHKANCDLIKPVYTDAKAETALDEFTKLHKSTKTMIDNFSKELAIATAEKTSLAMYDIAAEEEKRDKCNHYAHVLELLEPAEELFDLKPAPDVRLLEIPKLQMYKLRFVRYIDVSFDYDDTVMLNLANEEKELREGRCPTCKRKFFL